MVFRFTGTESNFLFNDSVPSYECMCVRKMSKPSLSFQHRAPPLHLSIHLPGSSVNSFYRERSTRTAMKPVNEYHPLTSRTISVCFHTRGERNMATWLSTSVQEWQRSLHEKTGIREGGTLTRIWPEMNMMISISIWHLVKRM